MKNKNGYVGKGSAILIYSIIGIICIVMFFNGCTSVQSFEEPTEKEEIDEERENDSIFFHEEAKHPLAGAREDDEEQLVKVESLSPVTKHKPSIDLHSTTIPIPSTTMIAYQEPEIPIANVSAGSEHSLLLDTFGNVWSSGSGYYGQLGNGVGKSFTFLPVRMESDIEAIFAGYTHSLLLGSSGLVYAFGDNMYYQLGLENYLEYRSEPVIVSYNKQDIEAGFDRSHFIDLQDNLYRVGNQVDIPIELIGYSSNSLFPDQNYHFTISPEETLVATSVIDIASENNFTMFIKNDLTLWAAGLNDFGQLGNGTTDDSVDPMYIMDEVIRVSTGMHHTLILRADNSLYSVGRNNCGQLGNGTKISSSIPSHIMDNIVSIDVGASHSLALDSEGTLWGFGNIVLEPMPSDTSYYILEPYPLFNNVVAFSAGHNFTLCVQQDGSLWVLGDNRDGQLGIENNDMIKTFTRVDIQLPQT